MLDAYGSIVESIDPNYFRSLFRTIFYVNSKTKIGM